MPYREEIFTAPGYREVKKYFAWRIGGKKKRLPNWNPTPEKQQAANRRRAEEKLSRIIMTNFRRDDLYVTLTYEKEPDYETAKKKLGNFLKRLRREYKKRGKELKYVYTTEYRGKRIHHHLIINDGVTRSECESIWGEGMINRYGFQRYDGSPDDAKNLAGYLVKEAARMVRDGMQKKMWVASRNLKPPKVVRRTIHARTWRETPRPPEGMELIEVKNLYTAEGFPMQLASFRKRGRQDE